MSVQDTPPEPELNVADTDCPSQMLDTDGTFDNNVGDNGSDEAVQV